MGCFAATTLKEVGLREGMPPTAPGEEQVQGEAHALRLWEGYAVACHFLGGSGPYDLTFHGQWSTPCLKDEAHCAATGHLDRKLGHQSAVTNVSDPS